MSNQEAVAQIHNSTLWIESLDFAADLSIANNLEMVYRIAQEDTHVQSLLNNFDGHVLGFVLCTRITALVEAEIDSRYRNPFDGALTVYFWLLSQTQSWYMENVAEMLLRAKNCKWSRLAAEGFLREKEVARERSRAGRTEVFYKTGIIWTKGIKSPYAVELDSPFLFAPLTASLKFKSDLAMQPPRTLGGTYVEPIITLDTRGSHPLPTQPATQSVEMSFVQA